MAIEVLAASADRWSDVERVMTTPGDPETCWCQVFRVPREDWEARSTAQNRADLASLVSNDQAPGLVAYDDDEPVGWVSVAPLADFVRLATSPIMRDLRPADDDLDGRWVITCAVVRKQARGTGLHAQLIAAAVDHARSAGAASIEAHPLDASRAAHVTTDELYAGTVATYAGLGFTPVADLGPERTLMTLRL